MIVFPSIEQGSPDWHEIRRGRATASRFGKIMSPKELKYSTQARDYILELIAECFETDVTENRPPDFGTFWTRRGQDLEPLARLALDEITGLKSVQVGFCLSEEGILGFSPDCLIQSDGVFVTGGELKCPEPKTHCSWVSDGILPPEHKAQVHGSMVIGGFQEYHFLSFCPGMQPFYIHVQRDDYTEKLAMCLQRFVAEYKELREALIPKLQLTLPAPQTSQTE